MSETQPSTHELHKEQKKERWKCQLEKDFPEVFISDVSIYPSYTQLALPYSVTCRQQYVKAKKVIEKQFLKELATMEMMQSRALDGVRVHRIFGKGFRVPKPGFMPDPLTPDQHRRVEKLLADERILK